MGVDYQQLFYQLRSTSTPLNDKLQLINSTLASSSSSSSSSDSSSALRQLLRDWIIDLFLRSKNVDQTILSPQWWQLLDSLSTSSSTSSSLPLPTAPTLPILTSFLTHYPSAKNLTDGQDVHLVTLVAAVWSHWSTSALRKANIDQALESYSALLSSSIKVLSRGATDTEPWQQLGLVHVQSLNLIIDSAGKSSKKVASHALSSLSSFLPMTQLLPSSSPLHQALLRTLESSLFNVENLRKGLARESYHANSSSSGSTVNGAAAMGGAASLIYDENGNRTESAAGELLAVLKGVFDGVGPEAQGKKKNVLEIIPVLTRLYFDALATHAPILFPLPSSKANHFATPSAARSAFELHSLTKRRHLAASWTRGVCLTLLQWIHGTNTSGNDLDHLKTTCLLDVLTVVEAQDLHRVGIEEGWEGCLEMIVLGAATRLNDDTSFELLRLVTRMDFDAITPKVEEGLKYLSTTALSTTKNDRGKREWLQTLLSHHSKSFTLLPFLHQISQAIGIEASYNGSVNNYLTRIGFLDSLREKLGGIVPGLGVKEAFEELSQGIQAAIEAGKTGKPVEAGAEQEGRTKKRRKVSSSLALPIESNTTRASPSKVALIGRLRILGLFIRALPTPLPLEHFGLFNKDVLEPFLRTSLGSKETSREQIVAGVEMLRLREAMLERMRFEGAFGSDEEWGLDKGVNKRLIKLVKDDKDGFVVVEGAKTLLQGLEKGAEKATAEQVIDTIWSRCGLATTEGRVWDGYLRRMDLDQLPIALWELLTRRHLALLEQFGTEQALRSIAETIVSNFPTDQVQEEGITIKSTTRRLLRRADLYELPRLRQHFHLALSAKTLIQGLQIPSTVLDALSASKVPQSLQSIDSSKLVEVNAVFGSIGSMLPMQYLGKSLRNELVERAFGLDLWIGGEKSGVDAELVEDQQKGLRKFVMLVLEGGSISPPSVAIISRLFSSAGLEASSDYITMTNDLYRHLTQLAIVSFKETSSPSRLIELVTAFEKPLSRLSKRFKQGSTRSTNEERAYTSLLDVLTEGLGRAEGLPEDLRASIASSIHAVTEPFGKTLKASTQQLVSEPKSVFALADMISSCRSIWHAKDWLSNDAQECDEVDTYAAFAQAALGATVSHVVGGQATTATAESDVAVTCLAIAELLAFRIGRTRVMSKDVKVSSVPFETLVACHLAFHEHLPKIASITSALDASLTRATSGATLIEYNAVLNDISSSVSALATECATRPGSRTIEATLHVALVLLRDGPEGSTKISSSCLSKLLQVFPNLLMKLALTSGSANGEAIARTYLFMAKFIEGLCGERPMLLTRLNVAAIFGIVRRLLNPSTIEPTAKTAVPSSITSELFLALVSTVSHLVRHRKDHITPLFHQLVGVLGAMLTSLRRSGYGTTTGSDELDPLVNTEHATLGKRAERTTAATFPFWVWYGGSQTIGREHAKAIGRLLISLSTKTTTLTTSSSSTTMTTKSKSTASLVAPLSKHAPFLILIYLRASVHSTSPIPLALRNELQGGWYEVMDAMGKWEREALMKGFLKDEDEAERAVLRRMWKAYEKERYRG
ncbi:BQ2448_1820 [Microbotryum intermedium]|uniref:BQ2448_1820 protein n=1 Tax=Microbotryum intermedium TaxID=269621 RepID=A0A238FHA1_9BASI|nr:BQ2448_1820 [Microbotryum intermedium]